MKEGQKAIYYATGSIVRALLDSMPASGSAEEARL